MEAVGRRSLLVLLDNCEHVITACAQLADALLRGCSNLALLATSREPLGIGGERVYRVPSMGSRLKAMTLGRSGPVRWFGCSKNVPPRRGSRWPGISRPPGRRHRHLAESLDIGRALNARYDIVYETFNLGLAEYLDGSPGAAEALFAEPCSSAPRPSVCMCRTSWPSSA